MRLSIGLLALLTTLFSGLLPTALSLTLSVPRNIPALPPSTQAILTTTNRTIRAPISRANTFLFTGLTSGHAGTTSYLLDIACKDYDFGSYGVDVKGDGKVEIYRVSRGGVEISAKEVVGDEAFEVRVLRGREYYESRAGFSPLSLLKNPMILIAVVGLAFVVGMPYIMDSMDPEMKKEFQEQQKKSILSGGASTANPLQNFDMAAWMAGKTSGSGEQTPEEVSSGSASASGSKARRRG